MLFNLVVNAVLWKWEQEILAQYPGLSDVDCAFYADNGKVGYNHTNKVQMSLDILTNLFQCLGLCMNAKKTKAMVTKG